MTLSVCSQAVAIKLHPLYVMLPCTICASLAFMLPVATPPNAIAFSYGNLKVMDMVRPMTLHPSPLTPLHTVLCVESEILSWIQTELFCFTVSVWASLHCKKHFVTIADIKIVLFCKYSKCDSLIESLKPEVKRSNSLWIQASRIHGCESFRL